MLSTTTIELHKVKVYEPAQAFLYGIENVYLNMDVFCNQSTNTNLEKLCSRWQLHLILCEQNIKLNQSKMKN